MKRTNKEIEADLTKIRDASHTSASLTELANLTGLTVQQVRTSLNRHPIVRSRVLKSIQGNKVAKKTNEAKSVVICDAPALVYGLQACTSSSQIVVPKFVMNTIEGLAQATDYMGHPLPEALKAKKSLSAITSIKGWVEVAPRLKTESLLVEAEGFSWRARAIVALACDYYVKGYRVAIKTRTSSILKLAKLQNGSIAVDFVPADGAESVKVN